MIWKNALLLHSIFSSKLFFEHVWGEKTLQMKMKTTKTSPNKVREMKNTKYFHSLKISAVVTSFLPLLMILLVLFFFETICYDDENWKISQQVFFSRWTKRWTTTGKDSSPWRARPHSEGPAAGDGGGGAGVLAKIAARSQQMVSSVCVCVRAQWFLAHWANNRATYTHTRVKFSSIASHALKRWMEWKKRGVGAKLLHAALLYPCHIQKYSTRPHI